MPGLSQLKKFSSDLLSLGDELTLRASRGEKPVKVEIPNTVEDVNDSEDFVLGMPQIEAEVKNDTIDEDLSDLSGLINPAAKASSENGDEDTSAAFAAPDLSDLLNPISANDDSQGIMPDLSMFEEQPEEEEVVEEEPEEVSIADMGLDALLAGAGFDAPAEEPEEETPTPEIDDLGLDDFDVTLDKEPESEIPVEETPKDDGLSELERDLFASMGETPSAIETPAEDDFAMPSMDDFATSDLVDEPLEDIPSDETFDVQEMEDSFDIPEVAEDLETPLEDVLETPAEDTFEIPVEDSFDIPEVAEDLETPLEDVLETPAEESFETPAEDTFEIPAEDSFDIPEVAEDLESPLEDVLEAPAEDTFETPAEDSFEIPAEDSFDIPEAAEDLETPLEDVLETPSTDDDFSMPSMDDFATETPAVETSSDDEFSMPSMEDFGTADLVDDLPDTDSMDMPEMDTPSMDDFGIPEMEDTGAIDSPAADFDMPAESVDFSADEEIPEYEDSGDIDEVESFDEEAGEGAPEVFDTSDIEGLDFGIPDTDSQLDGSADGDSFELGSDDEFAMEGEFEIPGYSDVSTAKEDKPGSVSLVKNDKGKKGKGKNLPEPDFTGAAESEDLPPNTLSDAQYKQFLANLGEYPLNVRLAFEDLIVQDEFTDDAEFEIIEKILNKAPARQVASMLEKMLDTSIPVPRDFEHRTAEEYEAYKKSLSYQLKNKIIPGILVGIVMMFVAFGLFQFSKNCIYKPLKANSLYKQGYALLQADEYPQSEMKFDEAVKYRINKNWFFKFARGYREHKQYQRAGKMYQNILYCFRHDKAAGLEYADMELNDLANYQRAEEIVRREVLDYHINDADGILMLGDVFLEWGTEKDPEKLELAREQYATLIQLYKANDLYLSRMMRYFIRSDNLRQVIQMQKTFEQKKEKSLCSEDWAELSGYLLDKYYGPLAPSDEYLRYEIEGLRKLLLTAVKTDPENPIALYNLSKYLIKTGETNAIESTLQTAIEKFNTVPAMKNRDIYKYIDSYRLLGEYYIGTTDYLQAQEQFAEGISLFTIERDNAGFAGTPSIGKLYEDMGNIKYSISGDYDDALKNYKYSVELENDNPSIRYRIGYIQYNNRNYGEALGSFMKSGDGNIKERNLLLAMANTLSLRGDDYAAQGYYDQLLDTLDLQIAEQGMVFPQKNIKDYDVVNTYLSASNNYGVTLYRLAKRTGNSALNAQAIVQFSQSIRAWDALTRNQETMVRLGGSNLAEMNIQYITHPIPEFEPSIYTEISKTLNDNEHL